MEFIKRDELNNLIRFADITVCDLVGIGFQDAVIASCVMDEYHSQQASEQD